MRNQFHFFLMCFLFCNKTIASTDDSTDTENNTSDDTDNESDIKIEFDANFKSKRVIVKNVSEIATNTSKPVLPEGCFFNFISNICKTILNKFKRKKIRCYYIVLSKSLHGLGCGFLQKWLMKTYSRKFKKYATKSPNIQKRKVQNFLNAISTKKPAINEFFTAMNNIFPIREVLRLEEYVFHVRNFGKGISRHIGQRTRDIWELVIFKTYKRLKSDLQWEIETKLFVALLEYVEDHDKTFKK